MASPFEKSADFAFTKAAGVACRNLGGDNRCGIHDKLRDKGFNGCAAFDCFGAGQRVSAAFADPDWRRGGSQASAIFAAFHQMYQLHALLWHLDAATRLPVPAAQMRELSATLDAVSALASGSPDLLANLDIPRLRGEVSALLIDISAAVRSAAGGLGPDLRGASLLGARLRGAELARADLFGATLIGADLREADLRGADLRGADLRGADLRFADLRDALFLSRPQLASARLDARTKRSEV